MGLVQNSVSASLQVSWAARNYQNNQCSLDGVPSFLPQDTSHSRYDSCGFQVSGCRESEVITGRKGSSVVTTRLLLSPLETRDVAWVSAFWCPRGELQVFRLRCGGRYVCFCGKGWAGITTMCGKQSERPRSCLSASSAEAGLINHEAKTEVLPAHDEKT